MSASAPTPEEPTFHTASPSRQDRWSSCGRPWERSHLALPAGSCARHGLASARSRQGGIPLHRAGLAVSRNGAELYDAPPTFRGSWIAATRFWARTLPGDPARRAVGPTEPAAAIHETPRREPALFASNTPSRALAVLGHPAGSAHRPRSGRVCRRPAWRACSAWKRA